MVKKDKKVEEVVEEIDTDNTVGTGIWNEIKDLELDLFGLPGQTVSKNCKRNKGLELVFPNSVHLTIKSSAVFPALCELMLQIGKGKKYEVVQQNNHTVVKLTDQYVLENKIGK